MKEFFINVYSKIKSAGAKAVDAVSQKFEDSGEQAAVGNPIATQPPPPFPLPVEKSQLQQITDTVKLGIGNFVGMVKKGIKPISIVIFIAFVISALFGWYVYFRTDQSYLADTTIVKAKGAYAYKNTTNLFHTQFKEKPTDAKSIVFSNKLGNISFYTPAEQTFGTISSTASPVTDGSTLTYSEIFPQLDLKYTISTTRLLEEFIVKSATAAAQITRIEQRAETSSTYTENSDGSITFSDNGNTVFTLPHPVMYEVGGIDNSSDGIYYEIKKDQSQLVISKVITEKGKAWLSDEKRKYPIAIDLVIDNADSLSDPNTVLDNADTAANWVSSDLTNTIVSQETTLKQTGTGSVKTQTTAYVAPATVDLMEYSSNGTAQAAFVSNSATVNGTGGTITTSGGYTIHTFTGSETFTPPAAMNVETLVVAGGGGGGRSKDGYDGAGGGGAGGYLYNSSLAVTTQSYSVTVGGGGAGGNGGAAGSAGANGGNSSFNGITAIGGGGGGSGGVSYGQTGGSGGGGAYQYIYGGSGTGGQGNGGGTGLDIYVSPYNGGSGGGAGGAGRNGNTVGVAVALAGGAGVANSISGSSVTYSRGGDTNVVTTHGAANTGNGGSGEYGSSYVGGNGGSGVVIIRYIPPTNLQSYSEATIKTQGTYALKGTANQTTSLNKTLTRTIASPLNLSDKPNVTFDLRASRTGSNIKVGLHDSGGTTTEVTPNITSANTFQSVTLDLSGVTNANKDAIDQIIVTIVNADATNTFYLDNMVATVSSSLNDTVTRTTTATDLSSAANLTFWVRSSVAGSFATFGFGESAATEQSTSITINQANTWEQKTWDISGITGTSRDAVTKYAFTFTGDTSGAAFYFDDIQAIYPATNWVSSNAATSTVSLESTIKQEGTGSIKVQTTAGVAPVNLDLMEYSSNGTAQSGYLTNALTTNATGGTITTSGGYTIHTFTTNGTFTLGAATNVEALVVAGGGGGGMGRGGGGGAGGLIYNSSFASSAQAYSITVGTGGPGATSGSVRGTNGNNSVFSSLVAIGGGGGESSDTTSGGGSGGSGGGGNLWGGPGGTGTAGQGNNGGKQSTSYLTNSGAGGGGGAGAVGVNGANGNGGNGGVGLAYSISGSSVYYAGGGGGSTDFYTSTTGIAGIGGTGGGGSGGTGNAGNNYLAVGGNGTAGTGGGGGGGTRNAGSGALANGGTGGSGIVIIRYLTPPYLQSYSESTIKTQGSYALKGIASQTTSLNKTLTRTIGSPLNLSGQPSVTFDLRASRTGSNIKVGLHDSGGTTTEVTPNIVSADTFQSVTLDLSGVTNANKDAIDQIIVTIVNSDAANTFYLDNMVAATASSLNDTVTRTTTATDLSSAANLTFWVRSSVAGSFATFGFGESAATEQSTSITINSPNTWEQKTWDISWIAGSARDAVTKYAFTFTGDTSGAAFYFDDIQTNTTPPTTPLAPAVTSRAATTVSVNPDGGTNSSSTQLAIYKETGTTCDGVGGSYIAANGSDNGATAVWQTDTTWGTVTATGLSGEQAYSFCVKAKNGNGTETAFGPVGTYNAGFIPLSGDYICTQDTVASNTFTNRYVDGSNPARYVIALDSGSGSTNSAVFEAKSCIMTLNSTDTLAVGSLTLSGGSIAIATGGQIKVGQPVWAIDADADGYTADTKLYVGSQPAGGVRKNAITTLATADCGDNTYSTSNVCCTVATRYQDADGDGYGNPAVSISACTTAGYVDNNTDCYDGNANAKPGSTTCSTTNRGDGSYDYNCSSSSTACGTTYYNAGTTYQYYTCRTNGCVHRADEPTPDIPCIGSAATCGAAGYTSSSSRIYQNCEPCSGYGPYSCNTVGTAGTQACQ